MENMKPLIEKDLYSESLQPQISERNIQNYLTFFSILTNMGFEQIQIRRALEYTECSGIEQAMTCLVKSQQGWEHRFIPDWNHSNKCYICRDQLEQHLQAQNFIRNSSDSYQRFRKHLFDSSSDDSDQNSSEKCLICYRKAQTGLIQNFPACPVHNFCQQCVKDFLECKISSNDIKTLGCPGEFCEKIYTQQELQSIISRETYQKYLYFLQRNRINSDPGLRWCVTPDCKGYARGTPGISKTVQCPICQTLICFDCGNKYHQGKTCEQIVDKTYQEWATGKQVQLCPRCKYRIEKLDGCNHITCSVCTYQWCWLCKGKYSENHYNRLNPFGCPNLQDGDNTRQNWNRRRIYLLRIRNFCFWVGIVLFFPVLILVLPSVQVFAYIQFADYLGNWNCLVRFLVASLTSLIVLAITPVVYAISIPFLILYFIGKGVQILIEKCCY